MIVEDSSLTHPSTLFPEPLAFSTLDVCPDHFEITEPEAQPADTMFGVVAVPFQDFDCQFTVV